jgi:predicted nucleic acid-binding protein
MATTGADKVFLDTNVLVYAQLTLTPLHHVTVARLQSLERANTDFWVSRQILRQYLAVMTRPGLVTPPIPVGSLAADVRDVMSRFRVAEEGPAVTANLLALLTAIPVAGKQVHDAYVVATMQAFGIPALLTHNTADFARFAAIITVLPLVG